jgi:hypothetical protein
MSNKYCDWGTDDPYWRWRGIDKAKAFMCGHALSFQITREKIWCSTNIVLCKIICKECFPDYNAATLVFVENLNGKVIRDMIFEDIKFGVMAMGFSITPSRFYNLREAFSRV